MFQDGKYWIPMGPAFMPRGYIPPPMYPRAFLPPMLMPRMPNMMHSYRPRIQRPKAQTSVSNVAPASSSNVQISEVASNESNKPSESKEWFCIGIVHTHFFFYVFCIYLYMYIYILCDIEFICIISIVIFMFSSWNILLGTIFICIYSVESKGDPGGFGPPVVWPKPPWRKIHHFP